MSVADGSVQTVEANMKHEFQILDDIIEAHNVFSSSIPLDKKEDENKLDA
jgi:hypothetical protein